MPGAQTPQLQLCGMHRCAHDTHLAGGQALGVDLHGGAAGAHGALGIHAQLHQAVHQVLDRALAHAGHTVQHEPAGMHMHTAHG